MLSFWSSRWAVSLLATAFLVGTASGQATFLRGNISDQEREAIENEIERVRGELGETYGQRPAANAPIANPRGSAPIKGSPYTPGRPMLNP